MAQPKRPAEGDRKGTDLQEGVEFCVACGVSLVALS